MKTVIEFKDGREDIMVESYDMFIFDGKISVGKIDDKSINLSDVLTIYCMDS